jgi:hypothetical protein
VNLNFGFHVRGVVNSAGRQRREGDLVPVANIYDGVRNVLLPDILVDLLFLRSNS